MGVEWLESTRFPAPIGTWRERSVDRRDPRRVRWLARRYGRSERGTFCRPEYRRICCAIGGREYGRERRPERRRDDRPDRDRWLSWRNRHARRDRWGHAIGRR